MGCGSADGGSSLLDPAASELTVGDEYSHLWYVSGTVVAVDEASNEIVVDLTDRGEGHFGESPVTFSCDRNVCPVAMFSVGQGVEVSYLLPVGDEGDAVANDIAPLSAA